MAIRLGIELSPVACRIVAVQPWRSGRDGFDTCVTFATMARSGGALPGAFDSLRGLRAAVVVWTPGADHRQVVVTDGSYEEMQAEARAAVRDAGRPAELTLSDIAPVPKPSSPHRRRRTVLLASAPADDIGALLQPLVDAGVMIDRILTPAAALVSLARARRTSKADSLDVGAERQSDRSAAPGHEPPATGEVLEAYATIDETSGCIALVQDGALLGAVDLAWGYVDELSGQRAPRSRDDVALRLADDLFVLIEECRLDPERLRHICVCGGVPDLRSMAMTLMERLDIEVEPLDSLFAIDEAHLPGNAEEFRERAPALRLAWAAAADPRPPLDLLRMRRRRAWGARMSRVVVAAGAAAGLVLGWEIQDRWQPVMAFTPRPTEVSKTDLPSRRAPASTEASLASAAQVSLPPVGTGSASGTPGPRTATEPVSGREPAVDGRERLPAAETRPIQRPIFRAVREPVPVPSAVSNDAAPRAGVSPRRTTANAPSGPVSPRAIVEAALPFEADLETILYGPDRRLALVDGRIVEVGDVVRGATIVEITTNAVMLRDGRGQLRRLTAGGRGR